MATKKKSSKSLCGDPFGQLDNMIGGGVSPTVSKKKRVKCPKCGKQFYIDVPSSPGINFAGSSGSLTDLCPWPKKGKKK